jgi:hypothetical protein
VALLRCFALALVAAPRRCACRLGATAVEIRVLLCWSTMICLLMDRGRKMHEGKDPYWTCQARPNGDIAQDRSYEQLSCVKYIDDGTTVKPLQMLIAYDTNQLHGIDRAACVCSAGNAVRHHSGYGALDVAGVGGGLIWGRGQHASKPLPLLHAMAWAWHELVPSWWEKVDRSSCCRYGWYTSGLCSNSCPCHVEICVCCWPAFQPSRTQHNCYDFVKLRRSC